MLGKIKLDNILFLDIETVPQTFHYNELDETTQTLWNKKSEYIQKSKEISAEEAYEKAAIYAEFGKVVCISAGYFHKNEFRLTSFAGDNEQQLLSGFAKLVDTHFNKNQHYLCAHNGKEFDFPYLGRRMLLNRVALPASLNLAGKKPWEVKHLDTMELWKFGDYKHYTSLNLLAHIFNIPTPKDDITGADVGRVYYEENDLARIITYCQKDVVTTARLYQRFNNLEPVADEHIIIT